MTPTAAEGRHRLPAQFCWGGLNDVDDDPGATLVLRGDGGETAAVARWLSMMQPDAQNWACISAAQTVVAEPILDRILSPCGMESVTLHRLRDRQVLQALVVGASVLRTLGQGAEQLSELAMGTEDYEHVRGLLRTRLVAAADEVCDPLAADMVGLANVYMSVKFGDYSDSSNPFRESGGESDPVANRSGRELITRREVADLGNVHSRLVSRLMEFLRRRPERGHDQRRT